MTTRRAVVSGAAGEKARGDHVLMMFDAWSGTAYQELSAGSPAPVAVIYDYGASDET